MMIDLIPLERIEDNPYQVRQVYDGAAINELANDIWNMRVARPDTLGLIQVPLGRIMLSVKNGLRVVLNPAEYGGAGVCLQDEPEAFVQLAAGHSRKRAFVHLAALHGDGYSAMPVDVVSLDNQAMSDIAWSENAKRRDLSAIEQALAIQRAMEEFGYSLREVAERWDISQSAASNKMRLLQLPDKVKDLVQAGELPERHARELLPLIQVGQSPRTAVKLAKEAVRDGTPAVRVSELVERQLHKLTRKIVPEMLEWEDWGRDAPLGECKIVCKGCPNEGRGRCAKPSLYDAKHGIWRKRLVALAVQRTKLPGIVDGYGTLAPSAVARAKECKCESLRVAFRGSVWEAQQVDADLPHVYYACEKEYGCECASAQQRAERAAEAEADPQAAELQAWLDEQGTQALKIGRDLVADLAVRFENALRALMPDELALFVALLKGRGLRRTAKVQYEVESIALALAEETAPLAENRSHRVGSAQLYRARIYGLARLMTPIDEVKAQLRVLRDQIREAELRDRLVRREYWEVAAAFNRAEEILEAHTGHQELRDELARLEALIEERDT